MSACDEVAKAQAAGFLLPCAVDRMQFYDAERTLGERIDRCMPQLTLELTERCNLSCRYCSYTYDRVRRQQPQVMSINTAHNAITTFLKHSVDAEARAISFWGGEPLLEFSLMRRVMEYIATAAAPRCPSFHFTTNATLITPRIASYLAARDVGLLISLDGPEMIHNLHRLNVSGRGSFEATMRGLKSLQAADADYYRRRVRINCVVARRTELGELSRFFQNEELLKVQHITFSPAANVDTPPDCSMGSHEDGEYGGVTQEQWKYIDRRFLEMGARGEANGDPWSRLVFRMLQRIALRRRMPVTNAIAPNGCCVPLLKKMHVKANGDVYLCEQLPHTNCVGNVNVGLDINRVKAVALKYAERSLEQCSKCWAMRLCGACYQHAMRHGEWNEELREAECKRQKLSVLRSLAHYTALVEENAHAFDELANVHFVEPL